MYREGNTISIKYRSMMLGAIGFSWKDSSTLFPLKDDSWLAIYISQILPLQPTCIEKVQQKPHSTALLMSHIVPCGHLLDLTGDGPKRYQDFERGMSADTHTYSINTNHKGWFGNWIKCGKLHDPIYKGIVLVLTHCYFRAIPTVCLQGRSICILDNFW